MSNNAGFPPPFCCTPAPCPYPSFTIRFIRGFIAWPTVYTTLICIYFVCINVITANAVSCSQENITIRSKKWVEFINISKKFHSFCNTQNWKKKFYSLRIILWISIYEFRLVKFIFLNSYFPCEKMDLRQHW